MREIENAVVAAVEMLIPKGSCSVNRWLTFEFEAFQGNRSFEWKTQYSTPSGYVNWRTLYGSVPHVKIADFTSDGLPFTPWIPEKNFNSEKHGLDRRNGVAPGFVISDGSHDSCWRDHACTLCTLSGYPHIPRNLYKAGDMNWGKPLTEAEAKIRINYEPTNWFRIFNDTTVKVKSISIEGAVGTDGFLSKDEVSKFKDFTDGKWENDTELEDCWAIIYGMSKLSYTVNKDFLEIRINGGFAKGVYDTRSFKETGANVHYRISNGLVTHVGIPKENDYFISGWKKVKKPYILDELTFLADCGITDSKWEMTNIFLDLVRS